MAHHGGHNGGGDRPQQPPPEFVSITAQEDEILSQRINWDKLSDSLASGDVINMIKTLEMAKTDEDLEGIFSDEIEAGRYCQACMSLLKLRRPKELKYLVTLLSKIISREPRRAKIFFKLGAVKSFERIWTQGTLDAWTVGKAAECGGACLRWGRQDDLHYQQYNNMAAWLLEHLRGSRSGDQLLLPLAALKAVAPNRYFQRVFVQERGVERLRQVLQNYSDHVQVIYLTVYCLWVLSFEPENCTHENLCHGQLLHILVNFVKAAKNPKIARISLLMFENLVGQDGFNETVILYGVYPYLVALDNDANTDKDDEQKASLKRLLDGLEKDVRILSSFERYVQELNSEKLTFGPVHSPAFWKKHATRFEDDDFNNIKKIQRLLDSDDAETVSVACYDLGEWARFYPDGKRVVDKLGAKTRIMEIVDNNNLPRDMSPEQATDLKKQALLAIQKLLIKDWSALSGLDES